MKNITTPRIIAEAGHTGEISVLERALAHKDPSVRAIALGSFNRSKSLTYSHILNALCDDSLKVRRRAAELSPRIALGAGNRSLVIRRLADCLDHEPELAEVAAFALGEIGSSLSSKNPDTPVGLESAIIEKLENQALNHSDALCREQAVATLGALHTGLETILRSLSDKATVRRRAVIALAPFDGPKVDAALRQALEDRDWQVRQAAEDLLEGSEDIPIA